MPITYVADDELDADEYLQLFHQVWKHELDPQLVEHALARTINVTARDGAQLVGCLRILSDTYLASFVCEVMIDPRDDRADIGKSLLKLAERVAPTGIMMGVQRVSPDLMRELEWQRGPRSYYKRKPLH